MELLPCPFCGKDEANLISNEYKIEVVECQNCHSESLPSIWNNRSSPWISVKDRLPDAGKEILASDCRYISTGIRSTDIFILDDDLCEVTHWMPLPPLPENK